MTDYWQPYQAFIPAEQHVQSKAETYTVEGYNSLFWLECAEKQKAITSA